MINIRPALESDEIFIIGNRLDMFLGDRDFYEVPNEKIMSVKNEAETFIKNNLSSTKIIIVDEINMGSFSVYNFEDGIILDKLALKSKNNTSDIKEFVIRYVLSSNYGNIYTFVDKKDESDLELYKRLGFSIVNEENNKYKLKITKLL